MMRRVSAFPGGSAWAMARDIADGYILVSQRTFGRMQRAQIEQVVAEINRRLRDVRSEQPDLEDIQALRKRNMRIQRLNGALTVVRGLGPKRRS
jgi:Mg2+ and Co2+ transporter CorA